MKNQETSDWDTVEQMFDFRGDTQTLYGYSNEPVEHFIKRITELRDWIQARNEDTVVFASLSHTSIENMSMQYFVEL